MQHLYLFTFGPSILIVLYIYLSDRFRDPVVLVISTFVIGHLICFPAGILNSLIIFSADNPREMIFAAGLIEEPLKFSVLYFFIRKRKMFDEPMDAIVYGTLISLGFATLENLEYVFFSNLDLPSVSVAAIRAFTAIPLHACCGIIMGYYFGLYFFRNKRFTLVKSLLVPTLIHCIYNYLTGISALYFILFLILVILFSIRLHNEVKQEQKKKLFEPENKLNV